MSDSIEALLARLKEAEDLLREIRSGGVDAVFVSGPRGQQVPPPREPTIRIG